MSHILPGFLFRKLKSGPTGTFVDARFPSVSVQDGVKVRLLCQACETRFSKWETLFKQTFLPLSGYPCLPIVYGRWLYKFAISVSWRVLTYLKLSRPNPYGYPQHNPVAQLLHPLRNKAHSSADRALHSWSRILLEDRTSASLHPQLLLFLNGNNFPGETRNVVGFSSVNLPKIAAVHSVVGPLIVLGIIKDGRRSSWQGAAIHPQGGSFKSASQRIPEDYANWLKQHYAVIDEIVP